MALSPLSSLHRAYFISPLITDNYASWSIKLELLLTCSEKWGVVNGSDATPAESNRIGLVAWKLHDSKACLEILLHCSEKQLISLRSLPTSKQVWDCLK